MQENEYSGFYRSGHIFTKITRQTDEQTDEQTDRYYTKTHIDHTHKNNT